MASKNLLIKQQSGFRRGRRTSDNLVFLSQKITESFSRGKKVLAFFFDIQAAFDTVWHNGLVYKLIQMGIPVYLVYWIVNFLADRWFVVRVDGSISERARVVFGVPQGSALSPILFSVFINDVPANFAENDSFTLLFADDLNTFYIYRKITPALRNKVNRYLKDIERWLCRWRLNMAPSKCQYTIFEKCKRVEANFEAKLFGERIPYEAHPVSLGVTFDPTLSFRKQTEVIRAKCLGRLNVIKILSHRSWKLTQDTLVAIYRTLVGSVIDYSFFMVSQLSDRTMKRVQVIQNSAMRYIFKKSRKCPTEILCSLSDLPRVGARMLELNDRYFEASCKFANELILDLARGFMRSFPPTREIPYKTLLCDFRHMLETVVFI